MVQQCAPVLFYVVVSKEGQDIGFVTTQPTFGTMKNFILFGQKPLLPVNYLTLIICFAEMVPLIMTLKLKHFRLQDPWCASKVYCQTLIW